MELRPPEPTQLGQTDSPVGPILILQRVLLNSKLMCDGIDHSLILPVMRVSVFRCDLTGMLARR